MSEPGAARSANRPANPWATYVIGWPVPLGVAVLAGREVLFMVASVVTPLHPYLGEVAGSLSWKRINRMRRVAMAALRNVLVFFRIVRHMPMGTGLFPAGRHIVVRRFNDLVERTMALKAL